MPTYDEARDQISDGDIVFFGPIKGNVFHRLIRLLTGARIVHTALAFWMQSKNNEQRLFVVEAHGGGRRIVPLSIHRDRKMIVMESQVIWASIEKGALDRSGSVPYGWRDYAGVALKELFGIPSRDHRGEICSETTAKLLQSGGAAITDLVVSPNALYDELVRLNYKTKFVVDDHS